MKMLAIKGHKTRGNEVIKLLEMLGGKNSRDAVGTNNETYYFIDGDGIIDYDIFIDEDADYAVFTLEEFLEKFPFKVRDFVRIPEYESEVCILKMKWCPLSEHIEYMVCPNDEEEWFTAVELLEDNDNPNKTRDCRKCGLHFGSVRCFDVDCPHNTPKFNDSVQGTYVIKIADGYKFDSIDENGNIILKSIKSTYPTTYEECCKNVFGLVHEGMTVDVPIHYSPLIINFTKLLLCRDAYWKIAGEEMGLDGPWEPNWTTFEGMPAIFRFRYNIVCDSVKDQHCLLVFPTEEMRDTFYNNFKDLIERCKELL